MRTAAALRRARIPHARTLRALRTLRKQLTTGRELTELRITADGERVVVHDGTTSWIPGSDQLLIDFDVAELAARAEPIARRRFDADGLHSAAEWFHTALDLEAVAPHQAQIAYKRALAIDPKHIDAHINLGRLRHEAGDASEAATHYLQALRYQPEHATAAFNLGVAMEDLGRTSEAVRAYRQCIASDDEFADAHYNLACLLEKLGDKRGAIRHLTRYRRIASES